MPRKCDSTFAQVGVDAHVACSPRQVFVFTVCNVFMCSRFNVFFRQSKVNDVNGLVLTRRMPTNEEILRLDISEDKMFGMHVLNSR